MILFLMVGLLGGLGLAGLSFWIGKRIPNGYPVLWKFHPAVIEGHKYVVRALYSECLTPGLSRQRCATLQDEYGAQKPFHVFFPSESECRVQVGQLVQPIWKDSQTYILHVIPPNLPMAC